MKKNLLIPKMKLFAAGLFSLACLGVSAQTTFAYTGAVQTYTVPVGVTSIQIECWGAQGQGGNGGLGGYVKGNMAVTPGQVLNVYVGGQAGFNGGGIGHAAVARNGGGGSDVRVSPYALANRVLVAGGGGGGGPTDVGIRNGGTGGGGTVGSNYAGGGGGDGYGGNGSPGGLNGGAGNTSCHSGGGGGGGSNSGGGASCNSCYTSSCGQAGTLGQGGNGDTWENGICYNSYGGTNGGGGGYYGGGGSSVGNCGGGGGGGGSSWVGTLTSTTMTGGIRTGNGQVVITVLNSFSATVTQTASIQCNGQSTAALASAPVGGTSPFAYSWAPSGGNTANATGLSAGTYTVTITDANSLVTTQTFTVTQPTAISAAASSTSISCNGGANGTATASVSGGSPGYTYSWSNGGTTATINGLTTGVYTYTVTDTHGCSSTQAVTVTQPTALASSNSQTNVSCFGGTNGDATVTVSGGTPSYAYVWSPNVGNNASVSGLSAGTYTCTVTDLNGCTTTQTVSITAPSPVVATAVAQPILCNGGGTTINVNGSGGVGPYSGTGTFTNGAGTFTYIVTDANGCSASASVTITEPTPIDPIVVQTNVSCNGGQNGTIDLSVNGGTSPYTYSWNNGQYTTQDLTGLPAGTYTGVITDANGCTNTGTVLITEPTALAVSNVSFNPTTCGGNDGYINTNVTGGTPGYTYLWSNNAITSNLTGISAGSFTCTITDANGCTTQFSATLSEPAPPVVSVSLLIDTVCTTDGTYALSGGSPSGGSFSGPGVSANSFNPGSAGAGSHTITYSYTDSQTGCLGTNTDVIFVDPCTGVIVPATVENSFNVFPNPNNGTFTLQLNTSEIADVLIYDAVGKLVSATKVQPNMQQQISIESAGVYMITVVTADGNRSSQRVVVSK